MRTGRITQIDSNSMVTEGSSKVVLGHEIVSLKNHYIENGIPEKEVERVVQETIKIFERCENRGKLQYKNTGIAIGYVQSGKTMSFTCLTALAKDNGFQLIVILAGVTVNLVNQSTKRIVTDLRLDSRTDRKWLALANPNTSNLGEIRNALTGYRMKSFPTEKLKTVVLTVMKEKNHLPNLIELLSGLDLDAVPVLIIDDEGDQASMNNQAKANARKQRKGIDDDKFSRIYSEVVRLKEIIPNNTFIQYTATPQAPLFIHLMDSLSPNFVSLLTPGNKYTGGKTFFQGRLDLVVPIEFEEIENSDQTGTPPDSLFYALMIYYIGVAEGFIEYKHGHRSMLVHPSQLTDSHKQYLRWITIIKHEWLEVLESSHLIAELGHLTKLVKRCHRDLSESYPDIPTVEELIKGKLLLMAIQTTNIRQVNSKNKDKVNWRDFYSHILVGGFKMDRGFTVEGLTVTYMPRSRGVGNADTIQQRARFFGYKKDYIGLCRVFIDRHLIADYEGYIDHEEDLRSRLSEYDKSNVGLNSWYREVYLPSQLRLTRPTIIYNDLERKRFSKTWFTFKYPNVGEKVLAHNREVVRKFVSSFEFEDHHGHLGVKLEVRKIMDELINQFFVGHLNDSRHYTALKYILEKYLAEQKIEYGYVYYISSPDNPRERSLNQKGQISQLFQGRNKLKIGLRDVRYEQYVNVQIYHLNIIDKESRNVIQSVVPTLAISLPNDLEKSIISWIT